MRSAAPRGPSPGSRRSRALSGAAGSMDAAEAGGGRRCSVPQAGDAQLVHGAAALRTIISARCDACHAARPPSLSSAGGLQALTKSNKTQPPTTKTNNCPN
eukprot:scaffold1214_cov349-Prasinococcus_capsulatus_cf.AAC.4